MRTPLHVEDVPGNPPPQDGDRPCAIIAGEEPASGTLRVGGRTCGLAGGTARRADSSPIEAAIGRRGPASR